MARRFRRVSGLVVVLAVSVAAFSTTTSAAPRGGGAAEADVGITADAINVALALGDTSALQQAGVIEEIGDRAEQFKVFVDLANEAGGAAGRQINYTSQSFAVPSTATVERPACIAATEDDQAFIVIWGGGQTEESLLCSGDEQERITIAIASIARESTYEASEGRLFTNDMSSTRLMGAWVKAMKKRGVLKGATIGIVRPDVSLHEDVAKTLTKAIEKAGFEVAEEVALPCEGQSCQQADIGAQKLQTSGVDVVFSLLPAIPNPSFIGASSSIGYDPTWLASDFEFQVYNTTAQFFEDQKDAYAGTVGISTTVYISKPDPARTECNAQYTEATGTTAEPLTDEWSSVGNVCLLVQRIVEAADAAEAAGGLTQKSFIAAYEKIPIVEGKRKGTYTPTKHDGFNTYQLYEFGPDCVCWEPIKGTVGKG